MSGLDYPIGDRYARPAQVIEKKLKIFWLKKRKVLKGWLPCD